MLSNLGEIIRRKSYLELSFFGKIGGFVYEDGTDWEKERCLWENIENYLKKLWGIWY